MKEYTIRDIEALTEEQAAAMAIETASVKGHQVYFVDFGGYFGYSVGRPDRFGSHRNGRWTVHREPVFRTEGSKHDASGGFWNERSDHDGRSRCTGSAGRYYPGRYHVRT